MNRYVAIALSYLVASYAAGASFLFTVPPSHAIDFGFYMFLASPAFPPLSLVALVLGGKGAFSVDSAALFLGVFLIAFGLIHMLVQRSTKSL